MKTSKLKPKRNGRVRSSELVRRFSDKQAELAAKISNDIADETPTTVGILLDGEGCRVLYVKKKDLRKPDYE